MDINQLFEMLDQIPKNDENASLIEETRKAIEKSDREFRKAEREGRVVYDDIHHRIYIKEKGEE